MSTDALEQLQSPAQIELLDAVDRLRLEGCGKGELDLPQLIVCGDQSSGKSSVLEAISRVQFPAADTFCTRFASELVLRRANVSDFTITLVPASDRSEAEKRHISAYTPPADLTALEDFPKVVRLAGEHIDKVLQAGKRKTAFYTDKLVAHIRGPHLPPLTLVDLPGLIHTSGESQTLQDISVVRKILNDYMSDTSSIILAVLAADNNKANQEVLQLAKNHDETGSRTLGVITKPDKVDSGSNNEDEWIRRLQNRTSPLRLGWHVLKNRSFEHRDVAPDQRDALETQFFETTNWAVVPKECRGVTSLRIRLSNILLRSVRECLPAISRGIEDGIRASRAILERLGQPKLTVAEQQKHLTEISFRLTELVKASVQARYNGDFYAEKDQATSRKVRSRLQDTLDDFVALMGSQGHRFFIRDNLPYSSEAAIIDLSSMHNDDSGTTLPREISRGNFVDSISMYIKQNRGCELPGLLSSEVVTFLFHLQSSPWEALAHDCVERCWLQVQDFFRQALDYVAPSHTAGAIMEHFAEEQLRNLRDNLSNKLKELLRPYRKDHLITLNKGHMSELCQSFSSKSGRNEGKNKDSTWPEDDIGTEKVAASQALSYMRAYYHVSVSVLHFSRTC